MIRIKINYDLINFNKMKGGMNDQFLFDYVKENLNDQESIEWIKILSELREIYSKLNGFGIPIDSVIASDITKLDDAYRSWFTWPELTPLESIFPGKKLTELNSQRQTAFQQMFNLWKLKYREDSTFNKIKNDLELIEKAERAEEAIKIAREEIERQRQEEERLIREEEKLNLEIAIREATEAIKIAKEEIERQIQEEERLNREEAIRIAIESIKAAKKLLKRQEQKQKILDQVEKDIFKRK